MLHQLRCSIFLFIQKVSTFFAKTDPLLYNLLFFFASYLAVDTTYLFSIYFLSTFFYDEFIKNYSEGNENDYGNFIINDRFDF
ncbi:hypothetical protein D1B31_12465 [Neobacillus notoginsengisoli]|uniref:Uncharacterized protein n=1 Tax=Neobacillus notoginsengisoli TaxID=1578198 RepID=A0A417YTM9_9BACI|nr:hypothetical protein D1B31_12465 [Neobacillus notoginsengisoli]